MTLPLLQMGGVLPHPNEVTEIRSLRAGGLMSELINIREPSTTTASAHPVMQAKKPHSPNPESMVRTYEAGFGSIDVNLFL